MEMEMEMVAEENIEIGEDLTPPLSPLACALHNSFLHSHCSSCFSPLPDPNPPLPSDHHPSLPLYCSGLCSSSSSASTPSPLHLDSHLRSAFHLLHSLPSSSFHSHRISGLLTNRDNLLEDENIAAQVRAGARAIAGVEDLEAAENALCLVLTNAVEVQDKDGRSLGVAVYDTNFSWTNHNCSPNACYRFLFSPPHHRDNTPSPCQSRLRLRPVLSSGEIGEYDNAQLPKAVAGGYGPRIIVRSIKRINRGDKVTLAYTDLLQPKAVRQSELWEKYRFLCCCVRCNSSPPSYVDLTLQELCTSKISDSSLSSDSTFCRDKAVVNIRDYVDEVISEYLSVGDAKICCEKLERVLIFGLIDEHLKFREGNLQFNLRLHHLHHLALNAYITLASAYKMQSCDSLVLYSELDGHQFDSFHTRRISAAYSFFLAAATNHLFHYEASLIASAANFWINAGESLVTLARSSDWSFFEERNLPVLNILYLGKHKCCKCSFLDRYQTTLSFNFVDFERTSREFLDCITSLSHKVWHLLSGGCYYLKLFKDPFDLGRHEMFSSFSYSDFQMKANTARFQVQNYGREERTDIFQLGVHCLLYGGFLSSICYGQSSHWTTHIRSVLYCGENK
ncbi:hypothetical protein K2173_007217 [Erythroxylum novogranatense]|uniref:SET domain-containing protein n=1 Tax=Erythroxylum novogranatense TaxID=1862640 RepID=A0AAV8T6X8_9ROSI|nr:hypothetical protein K2173_007217 [Erythroxylum novogranatense]